MKYFVLALGTVVFSGLVSAHPGRTASDGCHYCRTNCQSWGVAHGVRHCHGGGLKEGSGDYIDTRFQNDGVTIIDSAPKPKASPVEHTHDQEAEHRS